MVFFIKRRIPQNRLFQVGMILLLLSFILCKLFLFALPVAADLGRLGRGVFREVFIAINLILGYHFLPETAAKTEFIRWGIGFEIFFIVLVSAYAVLTDPPNLLMQLQVMLRELLLSPMYFFGFYMIRIKQNSWV